MKLADIEIEIKSEINDTGTAVARLHIENGSRSFFRTVFATFMLMIWNLNDNAQYR